jgi:CO/xanthine dehydrogenase FAD-binding subunit
MYYLDIHSPKTLEEALQMKRKHGEELHVLAGGSDVLIKIRNDEVDWGDKPSLLNITHIMELKYIKETLDAIEIGPLITHNEIIHDHVIKTHIPSLCKAASFIGSPQIRNQGTIGGNIVNASPAADILPILYARDAEVEVRTHEDKSMILIEEFIKGPGLVDIDPCGIVTKIVVPKLSGYIGDYLSLRQRRAISINVVSIGAEALITNDGVIEDIRIALGAVSQTVVRGKKTEKLLKNRKLSDEIEKKAIELIRKECSPIDDIRSNKTYRQAMTGILLKKFLQNLNCPRARLTRMH